MLPQKENTMQRRLALLSALGAALPTLPGVASAQAAYPTRSITMIVPFPPGGLADLVARPVADAMSRDLGQPVVVENKGGAGGGIGMGYAAKAPADGYTILMALASFSVLPEADALLGRTPMYSFSALRPIARFTAESPLPARVDAPVDVVYSLWSNFDYFPQFMSNVLEVRRGEGDMSHWKVRRR